MLPLRVRGADREAAGRRIVIGAQVAWDQSEIGSETASRANVDQVAELQAAAVESIRRLKSLQPEVIHLSHCPPYGLLDAQLSSSW